MAVNNALGKILAVVVIVAVVIVAIWIWSPFAFSQDCLSSPQPQKKEKPLKSQKKLKSLLLTPLLLLLVSLPSFGNPLQTPMLQSSIQQSKTLNDLAPNSEPVFQLTESQLYTLFDQVAKQASDKAVQLTVAEYKPKLDAALLDLKTANTDKWKMAGEGFLVGAGLVAVIVVVKGFIWK